MTELAFEIIHYAVLDWRRLINAKAWKADGKRRGVYHEWQIPNIRCNFEELRRFFGSEWCDLLLTVGGVSTTGERILALLEVELEEAKKADEKRERRKKK